jgi:hypothetical protein
MGALRAQGSIYPAFGAFHVVFVAGVLLTAAGLYALAKAVELAALPISAIAATGPFISIYLQLVAPHGRCPLRSRCNCRI